MIDFPLARIAGQRQLCVVSITGSLSLSPLIPSLFLAPCMCASRINCTCVRLLRQQTDAKTDSEMTAWIGCQTVE